MIFARKYPSGQKFAKEGELNESSPLAYGTAGDEMGKTGCMVGRVDIVLISAASLTVNGNIPVPKVPAGAEQHRKRNSLRDENYC